MITNEALMPQIMRKPLCNAFGVAQRSLPLIAQINTEIAAGIICVHLCNLWQIFVLSAAKELISCKNHYF
jgi:hypothetical protein